MLGGLQETERGMLSLGIFLSPPPCIQSGTPGYDLVPPTFRMGLPISVDLLGKHPYREIQKGASLISQSFLI